MFSMAPIVGYLPQHLAELAGSVIGALFVIQGLRVVITGRVSEQWDKRFGAWGARALGACVALVGVFIALSSFLIDAEPPGGYSNHWGETSDFVVTAIWLVFLGVIVAIAVRRTVREERQRRMRRRGVA
jgi:MFS family permease